MLLLIRPRLLRHLWKRGATPNDPDASTPMDTYSAPPQPAVPFPTQGGSTYTAFHHARFTSRVVHQIHFKIFTHSNNTSELFIEEVPASGISKCRDPEHYFYGLSGNWEWSLRTADYWRHHFELLYYMDRVLFTMFPSTRSLLLKHLTLPRRFEI